MCVLIVMKKETEQVTENKGDTSEITNMLLKKATIGKRGTNKKRSKGKQVCRVRRHRKVEKKKTQNSAHERNAETNGRSLSEEDGDESGRGTRRSRSAGRVLASTNGHKMNQIRQHGRR